MQPVFGDILVLQLTSEFDYKLAAGQGVDLRTVNGELQLGKGSEGAYRLVWSKVSALGEDRVMYLDIQVAKELLSSGKLVKVVRRNLKEKGNKISIDKLNGGGEEFRKKSRIYEENNQEEVDYDCW